MEGQIELQSGGYRLIVMPERGGSIARFDWHGEPLFRPACGPSILDTACFPLVPFSNRIAFGRFDLPGQRVQLSPNFPDVDHPHTLHGFGWLHGWAVVAQTADRAILRHEYKGAEWPWPYVAEQELILSHDCFRHVLRVTNHGDTPMPAGLGFHPYFPRTDHTVYRGRHKGEWHTGSDGLPLSLDLRDRAIDWWNGAPAGSRAVDTVYTQRDGTLQVQWPERALEVTMTPSDCLRSTVVYTPADADFLCVEPVSHATDAINSPGRDTALEWLAPMQGYEVSVTYVARSLE